MSGLITNYLASGLASARPSVPSIWSGATAFYYATDTRVVSMWDTVALAWVNIGSNKLQFMLSLEGQPLNANEVLGDITPPPGVTYTFPANLTTSAGLKTASGVNPASAYSLAGKKNGTLVANINISTGGVVTFTTVGGSPFLLVGGSDVLQWTGPAITDIAVGFVFNIGCTW